MEDESDESNYYNSNKIYENGNNNIFSNLSISDDPIPILIKSPKTVRNKFNFNKNKIKSRIQYTNRKKLDIYLLNQNIQKYKCSPEEYNKLIIDNLINLKENHLVSVFKDNLISANENEFLRGSFNINDCIEVLPKFYDYYRNYLMFFCKPTFNSFYINETIQEYGEKQAEVYYKNNYVTKRQKIKNNNLDEKNIEEDDDDKSSQLNSSDNKTKNNNETSFVSFRTFFSNSVESMIKKGINSMKKKEEKNKELSSIKPQKNDSDDNTIYLPDDSTISLEDIITKKSSIKNIIDLMKRKNGNKIRNRKKDLSNHKEKEIKKKGIIIIDKKKLIEGRNLFHKKRFNSFSKTTGNICDKSKKQRKNSNKNLITNINNNINNKAQPNSNYLKYAGVFKQNKYIKINNIPKIKVSSNDLILSPLSNVQPKKKSMNKIPSFKSNENIYNFSLTTRNHNINNLKNSKQKSNKNLSNTNKINLPLKIKNFYNKIKNINNNSNSSIQLSIYKTTNNRNNSTNPSNKNKKIINRTNYNFNKNKKYIKKSKVLPLLSPKTNHNLIHNKSSSYSTINNCNININNNIILSNNYIYNNKYLCFHNSQKQLSISNNNKSKSKEKNNINSKDKQNKVKKSIPLTSRNIKINLDKFKTDQYFVNSIIHQEKSNRIILRNKNEKNENKVQYTSFRKSNNIDIVINNKNINLYKPKKINNSKYNKNLVLKDTLTINKSKNNLNKNDTNSITHTYKSIYIKNNSNNIQRKIIYDYKNKYI